MHALGTTALTKLWELIKGSFARGGGSNGVYYIEGASTTAGAWLGSHSGIAEYYAGLMVAYKPDIAGSSDGTTLNINGLGAVPVVRNASSEITTHYGVNSVVTLVYTEDDGTAYWKCVDYDSDKKVSQYSTTTSASYPLLFKYASGTSSTSTTTNYVRYGNKLYCNPSTGVITATKFSGALTGNADTATKATQDGGGNVIADTYATKSELSGYSESGHSHSAATTSAAGFMSTSDKSKLDGIATGANKYTHPSYTAKSAGLYKVTVDASGHVSAATAAAKADITALGIPAQDTTYSAATTSAAGLMSAADKTKLDGIATEANKYSLPTASSSTLGGVKIGSNLSISSGVLSVPAASGSAAGVTVVYPAASCTSFSSDSGTVTPLAVQKGAKQFAITRPASSTNKAITRYSNTTGDVQDSKIIIEDVTNTKDSSKKAQVISIPAEGGKKMVYGYCTDQVDGTSFIGGVFASSATSYPYNAGLAIGGTSGNLLWKGQRVLDNSDLTTINSSLSAKASKDVATTSAAGLMSAADKTKLDGIATSTTATVLYSNTSGTTGTITLSKTAANYSFLEIQYTDGTRTLTRRVYSPNGKTVSIDRSVYGGGTFYTGAMVLTISGTSITRVTANCGIASFNTSGVAVSAESAQLPVTVVIGYA